MIIRANNKKAARINLIKNLLSSLDYDGKDDELLKSDSKIIHRYKSEMLDTGFLAD